MKRSAFITVGFLMNYVFACLAFMIFLNWYDSGRLDFSGSPGMAIGGLVFGMAVLTFEKRIFPSREIWLKSKSLYFLWQIFLGEVGLIGSFAVGNAVEMIISASDMLSEMIWIIPVMTVFYSVMMIPFGILLGIANGILLLFTHLANE